ncbi:MAG TPA: helix-turn-helix domain-containing protein [Azospirillum sp.]|nr:helix-turn-helix domain-containing protein [Azospirillum sp.]
MLRWRCRRGARNTEARSAGTGHSLPDAWHRLRTPLEPTGLDTMTPDLCRALRKRLGWSQEALAERATVSVSAVRAFERGKGSSRGYVPGSLRRAFEAAGVALDTAAEP